MSECCSQVLINGQPTTGGNGSSTLYAFSNTPTTSNVAAVVTVFGSFVAAANSLSSDGSRFHLSAGGDFVAAGAKSITFGLALSGILLAVPSVGVIVGSAQRRPWFMDLFIVRVTAASARVFGSISFQNNATAPAGGLGTMAAASLGGAVSSTVANVAVDWTVSNTFDIVYFQTATAGGDDMTRRLHSVERTLA